MIERATYGGIAVTSHSFASAAAVDLMARGGNAVDAAIGANAVMGVVAPETCGIGGDLFALVHQPGRLIPHALNASGRAGSGWDRHDVAGMTSVPLNHPLTATVPGCVDGWLTLSAELGRLPLEDVLRPAVDIARDGFPASPELAAACAARLEELRGQPAAQALLPNGAPPRVRQRLVRPDLARTLERIATTGRPGFYEGPVATGVSRATGGALTLDDLAANEPTWVAPLSISVLGHTGWTVPPNSQGYLALAALKILELLDPPTDPLSPDYVHLAVEAYRSVAWERDGNVADPETLGHPESWFLDAERLARRATEVDRTRRSAWPSPGSQPGGTTFLCVVDGEGWGVSLIQSNFHGIGSGIGVDDHGFLLHNRGAGFTLEPGHINELQPGRRPLHTLSPTLWTQSNDLRLLLGTRGGHQQPQLILQAAAHILVAGAEPSVSQELPRWWLPQASSPDAPSVEVESRMPTSVVDDLSARGHSVATARPWMPGWGPVAVIQIGEDGVRVGAADPRVVTSSTAVLV